MGKPLMVICPKCKRTQPQKRTEDAIYLCECGAQFDTTPDEGGDYFTDPSRRMELKEERAANRRPKR